MQMADWKLRGMCQWSAPCDRLSERSFPVAELESSVGSHIDGLATCLFTCAIESQAAQACKTVRPNGKSIHIQLARKPRVKCLWMARKNCSECSTYLSMSSACVHKRSLIFRELNSHRMDAERTWKWNLFIYSRFSRITVSCALARREIGKMFLFYDSSESWFTASWTVTFPTNSAP